MKKGTTIISASIIFGVVALAGVFWGNISSDRERISKLEEAVSTIKGDTKEIKSDIKTLLQASVSQHNALSEPISK